MIVRLISTIDVGIYAIWNACCSQEAMTSVSGGFYLDSPRVGKALISICTWSVRIQSAVGFDITAKDFVGPEPRIYRCSGVEWALVVAR